MTDYKLVPVEPTPEMIEAGNDCWMMTDGNAGVYWGAMLAAAPDVQGEPSARCEYCDGTGDVHSPDGEWRGECHCTQAEHHPDDVAVDRFAAAMKGKMAAARLKGRSGWDDRKQCSDEHLAQLLLEHLYKGNPGTFEDVANFCMMLHQRGADPAVLRVGREPVAHRLLRRNGNGEWVHDANHWACGAPPEELVIACRNNPALYRVELAYSRQLAAPDAPAGHEWVLLPLDRDDVTSEPAANLDQAITLLEFCLGFALCNRDHGGTRRDVKKAQLRLEEVKALLLTSTPAAPDVSAIPPDLLDKAIRAVKDLHWQKAYNSVQDGDAERAEELEALSKALSAHREHQGGDV